MTDLYKGKAFSPETELSSTVNEGDTTIPVNDANVFLDGPNLATINFEDKNGEAETIKYDTVDTANNELTGVTRGVEGDDQEWPEGTKIARVFTAKDLNDAQENVKNNKEEFSKHEADNTPHLDANGTHNWGFRVNADKSVTMLFEEVS